MTKQNIILLLLLCVFCLTAACTFKSEPPASPAAAETTTSPTPSPAPAPTLPPTPPEPTPTPDPTAEELAGLSTAQKVGQLLVAGIDGTAPGQDAYQYVQEYQLGGIILFRRNVESAEQLTTLTNSLKELNGDYIPLFLCVDQEGGRVDRMPPEVSRTPAAYTVGQALSSGAGADYGALLAEECAAFGFNMDFAPCLDIWSNPDNTVIGDRALGTDWERVGELGFSAVEAMRAQGTVIPVVKHFPGHGDTAVDSHMELPIVDKTLDALRQNELLPFDMVLSGTYFGEPRTTPAPAVMVAHILMTQLDPDYPASLSPAVVTGLLREELGFEGVVCTDDLTMGAICNTYGLGEAAVLAVEAGCDLLLVCGNMTDLDQARDALLSAVEDGRISQARLDESVYRLLALKREYHLSNAPVEPPDIDALNAQIAQIRP